MTNNKFSLVDWLLRQVSDGTEKIIILTPENSKRLHDELSALRQYQQPTDEAVQRAIDWLETGEFEIQVGDDEYAANSSHHPNTIKFRQTLKQAEPPKGE